MKKKNEVEMKVSRIRKALDEYEGLTTFSRRAITFEGYCIHFESTAPLRYTVFTAFIALHTHADMIRIVVRCVNKKDIITLPNADYTLQEQIERCVKEVTNFFGIKKQANL